MNDPDLSAGTCGQLGFRTAPADLASLLIENGVNAGWNKFCVDVTDCSHFKFVFSGGHADIDADADTLDEMIADTKLVSDALSNAGAKHCFEVLDHLDKTVMRLHYDWPDKENT